MFLLDKPDWKAVRDHLQKEGRVDKQDLIKLIVDTNKILSNYIFFQIIHSFFCLENEGNLIYLQDPLTVVGDIHGFETPKYLNSYF